MSKLTREEHIQRHKDLHKALDELVADWIAHNYHLPMDNFPEKSYKGLSGTSIQQLMEWSSQQVENPTELP